MTRPPVAPPPGPSPTTISAAPELLALRQSWQDAWPEALSRWSRYTRLTTPLWLLSPQEATEAGLTESFAAIRFIDHQILINLHQIEQLGLQSFSLEILCHEIGHHILAPASGIENARLLARIRAGLPTLEAHAPMISNLYTDLLINDRLQRQEDLLMAEVFIQLERAHARQGESARARGTPSRLWELYLRIYERLWQLPARTFCSPNLARYAQADPPLAFEGDAWLAARLIRTYAHDWIDGAGGFAVLCLPYMEADRAEEAQSPIGTLMDATRAGEGILPDGLSEVEPGELEPRHPALDPRISENAGEDVGSMDGAAVNPDQPLGTASSRRGTPGRQGRNPYQYGELLRALGLVLDDHDAAVHYYREQARRHRVPFPRRKQPLSFEIQPEGLASWEPGESIERLDLLGSLLISPQLLPGFTTVQRLETSVPGSEALVQTADLDLYVDCSGSMPNPQREISYLTLAGAIIALSALRAGGRVKSTLWSGKGQYESTPGFVRDETAILRVLTGYLGGGTDFPIHVLNDTFEGRANNARKVHILVISDDGVTSMFDGYGKKTGWDVARMALDRGGAGGTLLLNLGPEIEQFPDLRRAKQEGWDIWRVTSWDALITLAREFSRRHYQALE